MIYCGDSRVLVENGKDGEQGPQGPPGHDGLPGGQGPKGDPGISGQDGVSCDVLDNLDGTCIIKCVGSSVLVYDCGIGAEPLPVEITEAEPESPKGPCGAFGGLTVVAMLMGLGFMRFSQIRK